ncbi:MAG: DinB family protein [Chloroflexi bacterium]|nr:DinB family protein [Chloroflexota bacterium]
MPTPAQYIARIEYVDRNIKKQVENLTHADSMKQLPFPGNCMNWNLGHILVYRDDYLGVIDGVSAPDKAEFAIYGGGSKPLTDSAKAIPLEMLIERLDESSVRLKAAFASLTPEKLSSAYESWAGDTLDDHLHFYVVVHEAMHLGQLEILRELALSQK